MSRKRHDDGGEPTDSTGPGARVVSGDAQHEEARVDDDAFS